MHVLLKVLVVCLAGCAVVSVFGSGNYDRKKKGSSRLSGGLCCCVSFWFWRLRPEKKVPVVCLAGCAVVSVFGSGVYDRKKKLQSSVYRVVLLCQFLVLAITTGKKKFQSALNLY